jgi:hypothetical protein
MVPSSLMLSVTTYISSDIAAVPMLWSIPLAIYLEPVPKPVVPSAAGPSAVRNQA